jgi:hypothetical protein
MIAWKIGKYTHIDFYFDTVYFFHGGIPKKIMKQIAYFFRNISRFFFRHCGLCNRCGIDCGMNSVINKHGFLCWRCHDYYKDLGI